MLNSTAKKLALKLLPEPLHEPMRAVRDHFSKKKVARARLRYSLPFGAELRIDSHSEWNVFCDIFIRREYDQAIHAALDLAAPHTTFHYLDLGANVGYFTMRLLQLAWERNLLSIPIAGTLIEGNAQLSTDLQNRLAALAKLPNLQLRVINGLAGRRSGHADLHRARLNHLISTIVPGDERFPLRSRVAFVDLGKVLETVPRIHLLKCDIEGAEQEFLENNGDLLAKVDVGCVELHPAQCDAERCLNLIRGRGFEVQQISNSLGYDDYMFVRREKALAQAAGRTGVQCHPASVRQGASAAG
jgi:FkbM family methyltransferase